MLLLPWCPGLQLQPLIIVPLRHHMVLPTLATRTPFKEQATPPPPHSHQVGPTSSNGPALAPRRPAAPHSWAQARPRPHPPGRRSRPSPPRSAAPTRGDTRYRPQPPHPRPEPPPPARPPGRALVPLGVLAPKTLKQRQSL